VSGRAPLRAVVAVGLVAGSTLALQVLLTRIFSAALFYHFAFFAISLALLGTGAGAILLYLRPGWVERPSPERALARWTAAYGALLLVVPALLVRLDYSFDRFEVDLDFSLTLALAALLAALPFLAAGVTIALAIKTWVAGVARVYAFDLAGAGLGALAIVPLLWVVDAPTLVVALGVAAGVAALLFAGPAPAERALAAVVTATGVALVLLSSLTALYELPGPFDFTREPVAERWTPISRAVAYPPGTRGGDAIVSYDQDVAPVPGHRPGEPLPDWRRLGLGPQSIGYELSGPGRTLVIGGGGGRDVYNALSSGQRQVDVIELNRAIRDMVDEDLARWSGRPFELPGVSVAIGDGRSTLAARDTLYDQVHIGFTNTLTAGSGSAYALSENNLYTVEAFDEYLDHLRPGGLLSVSRLYRFAGDEVLRATVLALTALERRGVEEPERHVVVMLGRDTLNAFFGTVLVGRDPFSAGQLDRVAELAPERTLGVVFGPGSPPRREWRGLAAADSPEEFCESYPVDVCAPTDDRPFFLNPVRLSDLGEEQPAGSTFISRTPFVVLLVALAILAALSGLAFVLPLLLARAAERPPVASLTFFAAIGVGFLVLEVALIQRFVLFLGFPTYALSVVLFALLLFTGTGALLSARLRDARRGLVAALSAATVLIVAAAFGLQPLLRALIELPFAGRVAIAIVLLAPAGLLLGTAMPVGLGRLSALYPAGVPWAWGINGVTSVLASVLAVFVAINWGFTVTTLLAAACYAVAAAHAALGAWPDEQRRAGPVREREATSGVA
jgi:hypothetical protein